MEDEEERAQEEVEDEKDLRYRDDILIVYSDTEKVHKYTSELRTRISLVYKLTFEGASRTGLPMLDIFVGRLQQEGLGDRIGYRPFTKPSSCATPLGVPSAHQAAVHSWPCAHAHRLPECSAVRADFNSAKWNFAQRLMSRNVPDNVVLRMLGVDPFLGCTPRSQVAREFCRDNSSLVSEAFSVITHVLRFHPVLLQAEISCILREEFPNSFLALRYLCGGDYTPRLSWSRAGPALFSRCRSAYREKGWQQHFSIQWV